MGHRTFLKIIINVSAYIQFLEPGSNLGQIRPKLAKIGPTEPNSREVPIVIVETCPFGSRHRFDWYDIMPALSSF